MAIRDRETLKKWFSRGAYPTESQFSDWIDSFLHSNDKIPINLIQGLAYTLNSKYDSNAGNALSSKISGLSSETERRMGIVERQLAALGETVSDLDGRSRVVWLSGFVTPQRVEEEEYSGNNLYKTYYIYDPEAKRIVLRAVHKTSRDEAFFAEWPYMEHVCELNGSPFADAVYICDGKLYTWHEGDLHAVGTGSGGSGGVLEIGENSGLDYGPDGKLIVNCDGQLIAINRLTHKLTLNYTMLPLKTVNGISLWADEDEDNIEIAGGGSSLTPWQQNYLDGLEDAEVKSKFAVSLSASPSSKEIDGQATLISLTAKATYNGAAVEAEYTWSGESELTMDDDSHKTAKYTYAVPTAKKGSYSKSFTVKAKYNLNGSVIEKSASASFSLYAQCRILQTDGTGVPDAAAIAACSYKRRNITGTYDITVTPGKYVWLCVPDGVGSVSKITSGGFAVPFEAAVNVDAMFGSQTVTFRCYRISGAPQSSPMSVTIS